MRPNLDINDILQTFRMMKKMGPAQGILRMIPGLTTQFPSGALAKSSHEARDRIEAIIHSMTPEERTNPDLVDASRSRRIATDSGASIEEVDNFLKHVNRSSTR